MITLKKIFFGIIIGAINLTLGTGGGMVAVPIYKKFGFSQKEAQIHSVATILPITIISIIIYLINGNVNFKNAYPFLLPGFIGSIVGAFVIKYISNKFLNIIFSLFMIWAGFRMVMRWTF